VAPGRTADEQLGDPRAHRPHAAAARPPHLYNRAPAVERTRASVATRLKSLVPEDTAGRSW